MNILRYLSTHFWQFIIATILLIMVGLLVMYFFPFKVASFNKIDVTGEVRAGGTITYQLDLCRYVGKGTKVDADRFLVPDGKPLSSAVQLSSNASLETTGDAGCFKNPPVTIPVEVGTTPGKYRLLIRVQYCIFPGRCIPIEKLSEPFNISQPSIPDQISVINKNIESVNRYLQLNPEPVGSIGNVLVPQSATIPAQPTVTQPETQAQVVNPQQTANSDIQSNSSIIKLNLGLPILNLLK